MSDSTEYSVSCTASKPSLAQRFLALFRGLDGVHGTHGEPNREGLKWAIKKTARTLREPVTVALWEQHLAGERPLGVVPICADDTCRWASIDVDQYDINLLEVVERVERAGLPLVPCRSKSGGLHLFMFFAEPQPADAVQALLRDLAARLGLGGSEVFPKQATINTGRGDAGNWMVMPYFGGTFEGRLQEQVGLKKTGAEMTVTEFLLVAEKARVTAGDFRRLAERPHTTTSAAPFGDAPRCLQVMAEAGVPEGMRNNTLFMVGIYCRKKWPSGDDWKHKMEEFNQTMMHPPLAAEEVVAAQHGLERKDYEYTCKAEPMCSHCDAASCRTRRFGVGGGGGFPVIEGLTRVDYEEPLFHITTPFGRMTVTTHQLCRFEYFNEQVAKQLGRLFTVHPKHLEWTELVDTAMRELTVVEEPARDLAPGAEVREVLEEFLTNMARGHRREDILLGRPWEADGDEDPAIAGWHYFRLRDLMQSISRQGLKGIERKKVTDVIKGMGGGPHSLNIPASGPNRVTKDLWRVPSGTFQPDPEVEPPPMREHVV